VTAHQAGIFLFDVAIILVLARLFGTLARRIGQPPVIGEIFAGILVGPSLFHGTIAAHLFPTDVRPFLSALATIGLVLFMFIVGYELDQTLMRGKERIAVSVSVGSIILPFTLGAVLAWYLLDNHPSKRPLGFILFMGAAMSVTAFPVLARILTDRGMHRTALGGMALASAAVDDILAWSLLAVVITVVGATGADQWHVLLAVPFVVVMFAVVRPQLRRLVTARTAADRLTPGILSVVLIGLLLCCFATEWLGVHYIFGAFLFGAIMPREGGAQLRHEILERLEQVSVLLLLPVFFVVAGLRVDLSKVGLIGVGELALILAVAIVGKFVGAFVGARLQKVPTRKSAVLATLMNTRGLTEIVILTVGLQLGVLDGKLFSLMVVMALVTTVMAGPILSRIYPRRRIERDVADAEQVALGAAAAQRVMVVVPELTNAAPRVALGLDLAGGRRPAELVLSYLLPYRASALEVGSGLTGELLEMTETMGQLEALGAPARAAGVQVTVLSRFSDDVARDLAAQATTAHADAVVVASDQAGYEAVRDQATGHLVTVRAAVPAEPAAVVLRWSAGPNGLAAARVAALVAVRRGLDLVVVDGDRPGRRAVALAEELARHGCAARADAAVEGVTLAVAAEGAKDLAGVHLVVRAERDPEPPDWAALLARLEPAQPTAGSPGSRGAAVEPDVSGSGVAV
jgi:Kef-type K+ transport system membrane component KefB